MGIKGSKYLINKSVQTSQRSPIQHRASLKAAKMQENCPYWTRLRAVMSKIHHKSQSELLLWGMKVSQQREDRIYFIAWLKSIWCVRCWGLKDEMSSRRLLGISPFPPFFSLLNESGRRVKADSDSSTTRWFMTCGTGRKKQKKKKRKSKWKRSLNVACHAKHTEMAKRWCGFDLLTIAPPWKRMPLCAYSARKIKCP